MGSGINDEDDDRLADLAIATLANLGVGFKVDGNKVIFDNKDFAIFTYECRNIIISNYVLNEEYREDLREIEKTRDNMNLVQTAVIPCLIWRITRYAVYAGIARDMYEFMNNMEARTEEISSEINAVLTAFVIFLRNNDLLDVYADMIKETTKEVDKALKRNNKLSKLKDLFKNKPT